LLDKRIVDGAVVHGRFILGAAGGEGAHQHQRQHNGPEAGHKAREEMFHTKIFKQKYGKRRTHRAGRKLPGGLGAGGSRFLEVQQGSAVGPGGRVLVVDDKITTLVSGDALPVVAGVARRKLPQGRPAEGVAHAPNL
nr:hypothetical protein [Tanacetum cinerariifolium]